MVVLLLLLLDREMQANTATMHCSFLSALAARFEANHHGTNDSSIRHPRLAILARLCVFDQSHWTIGVFGDAT